MGVRGYRLTVYKDQANEWRWRLAYRSTIIADSGEGYVARAKAVRAAKRLSQAAARAELVLA